MSVYVFFLPVLTDNVFGRNASLEDNKSCWHHNAASGGNLKTKGCVDSPDITGVPPPRRNSEGHEGKLHPMVPAHIGPVSE